MSVSVVSFCNPCGDPEIEFPARVRPVSFVDGSDCEFVRSLDFIISLLWSKSIEEGSEKAG